MPLRIGNRAPICPAAGNASSAQLAAAHLQVPIASSKWAMLPADPQLTAQLKEQREAYRAAMQQLEQLRKAGGGQGANGE